MTIFKQPLVEYYRFSLSVIHDVLWIWIEVTDAFFLMWQMPIFLKQSTSIPTLWKTVSSVTSKIFSILVFGKRPSGWCVFSCVNGVSAMRYHVHLSITANNEHEAIKLPVAEIKALGKIETNQFNYQLPGIWTQTSSISVCYGSSFVNIRNHLTLNCESTQRNLFRNSCINSSHDPGKYSILISRTKWKSIWSDRSCRRLCS